MSDFLKSIPIFKQLGDVLNDYPLITAALVLIIAAIVPYTGIENADTLQGYLGAFALFVYSGGSVWDFIDKWQNKPDIFQSEELDGASARMQFRSRE